MESLLGINLAVMQIGTHVGLHIDFVCENLECADSLHQQLRITAEAAKLLSTLGFDTEELDNLFEVDSYATKG